MKLFLLDAYALIYRSYYAFMKNPRVNSKGMNVSAIFGFVNTLEEVLRKENPDYIAVAFDPRGKTFRHEMYEPYKAQREETPEVIRMSVPIIKDVIKAYNIQILEIDGYEADDVIGTIAKQAEKEDLDVYMMTPDKDYAQLTSDRIYMYKPKHIGQGIDILDAAAVIEKYEVSSPLQIIDMLGIMGDTSDNIPGCPGVGPKTAQKLLKEYNTVENIIANAQNIKGALGQNIAEHKDQILLSKVLATIKIDVPVEFKKEEFEKKEINREEIESLFEELEFRTIMQRILGVGSKQQAKVTPKGGQQLDLFGGSSDSESDSADSGGYVNSAFKTIRDVDHNYQLVDKREDMLNLAKQIQKQRFCSFDTETTGLDPIQSLLVGMSFSFETGKAYYVPVPMDMEKAKEIISIFKEFLCSAEITKIGQNIKYDIVALKKYGINVSGPLFDTMIAHYLISPELRHNMDYLAEIYLNYQTIHIDELIGARGKNQKSMKDLTPEQVYEYACEDADITLQLKEILAEEIKKTDNENLFFDIELPLVYVLADMEYTGVSVDKKVLEETSVSLNKELSDIEKEICELAGVTFNVNSAKQVGEILFDKLKIVDKPKKTKGGQYTTGEEVLEKLRNTHPIVPLILEYRSLKKLVSSYADTLPELIDKNSKIHTSYNQTVAVTGRLSSSNPNLQNIPIRGERGKEIRKAFVSEEGCTFFSADYSQIELRIMAHLSQDKAMIEAFNSGQDIHAATAAKIYKIPIGEVTSDMRRKAKTANFGIIYGISVFGLAERLTIPRGEAKELIDGYFETFPQVKEYMNTSILIAQEKGYVETIFGRKRYLPDINSNNAVVRGYAERNAINAPIQGSAADIIKVAMSRIYDKIKQGNFRSKMVLQVHDELDFNVHLKEMDEIREIVIQEMENACKLSVPLQVDCGTGSNWLKAH